MFTKKERRLNQFTSSSKTDWPSVARDMRTSVSTKRLVGTLLDLRTTFMKNT